MGKGTLWSTIFLRIAGPCYSLEISAQQTREIFKDVTVTNNEFKGVKGVMFNDLVVRKYDYSENMVKFLNDKSYEPQMYTETADDGDGNKEYSICK